MEKDDLPKTWKVKNKYGSLSKLIAGIPDDCLIQKMDISDKSKYKRLIMVFPQAIKEDDHFGDHTHMFVQLKNNQVWGLDMKIMQAELASALMKHFTPEKFMSDFVKSLEPVDLIEAYDRAIIRKGKVREREGCYKFEIFGKRGPSLELMMRN